MKLRPADGLPPLQRDSGKEIGNAGTAGGSRSTRGRGRLGQVMPWGQVSEPECYFSCLKEEMAYSNQILSRAALTGVWWPTTIGVRERGDRETSWHVGGLVHGVSLSPISTVFVL